MSVLEWKDWVYFGMMPWLMTHESRGMRGGFGEVELSIQRDIM
ncbi:hypothetical protein SNOG_12483 [Parastagonospora nodorum SN15]|uniref:Uncharacterized protein n=1 Tax=Phaeosphaeria nodorum (strain SN15 / ATCC MYA-4574 / FGSC 10173) TaxID=321614 RepID=Q0U6Y1_PHANO|nr:hypothetical protein SNOG_12483 [Parastagonospora nodorum SN15]EAT80296.1 hypothetical protein SNOG_12483 [Parastagonospora nodorum SN15]